MTNKPLLIFDFDGVIVDGLYEYWESSRTTCLKILGKSSNSSLLPLEVPPAFRQLRPWVHKGWEMVVLAAELLSPESSLLKNGSKSFSENYDQRCKEVLNKWQWSPDFLQYELDNVRREAIINDLPHWLASHQAFPEVIKRLNQFNSEGIEFGIITTKSAEFTDKLLRFLDLKPAILYGHESGSKPTLLLDLLKHRTIKGFIEDRRSTLELVLKTPGLNLLPCYLASWGYLKPEDSTNLPPNIHLLEPKTLATPLASWS